MNRYIVVVNGHVIFNVTGKNADEAILKAIRELKLESSNIDATVRPA